MTNKFKAFAFDLDGTLWNHDFSINLETLAALNELKKRGFILMIATGRPYFDLKKNIESLHIFDYLVCNNGSYFYTTDKKIFEYNGFVESDAALQLFEICLQKKLPFVLHTSDGVYRSLPKYFENNEHSAKLYDEEWKEYSLHPIADMKKIILSKNITQASISSSVEIVEESYRELMEFNFDCQVFIAGEYYLDVNPKNSNKAFGISKIINRLGISLDQVVAFGDSGNDIEMLSQVGLSFAMENGTENAKKVAAKTIGKCGSNTIGMQIRKILNGEQF